MSSEELEQQRRKKREKEMRGWLFRMDYWIRMRLILLLDWLVYKLDGWSQRLGEREEA